MSAKTATVLEMSRNQAFGAESALIDAPELASKWRVPVSWVRDRTRSRTPREHRIPCIRLGRYVRFKWPSAELDAWLERHQG
jgi:hypothetical protein